MFIEREAPSTPSLTHDVFFDAQSSSFMEKGFTTDTRCIRYQDLISFAARDLDKETSQAIRLHITACKECARTVARYRTIGALYRADESQAPPFSLKLAAENVFPKQSASLFQFPRVPSRQSSSLNWYQATIICYLFLANLAFFGGMGAAVSNAQDALPGDSLYGVKIQVESLQLAMAFDEAGKAQSYLGAALSRKREIEILVVSQRYEEIPNLVNGLEASLNQASLLLARLEKQDSAQAKAITKNAQATLKELGDALEKLEGDVPETIKPSFDQAVRAVSTERWGAQEMIETKPDKSLPTSSGMQSPSKPPTPNVVPGAQKTQPALKNQPVPSRTPEPTQVSPAQNQSLNKTLAKPTEKSNQNPKSNGNSSGQRQK